MTESIHSRSIDGFLETWATPIYPTTPNCPLGILAQTPCNLYFSTAFWEETLRRWALSQYVSPQLPIRFIETSLPLTLSVPPEGDRHANKRKWIEIQASSSGSFGSPLKRMCTAMGSGSRSESGCSKFLWGFPGEVTEQQRDCVDDFSQRVQAFLIEDKASMEIIKGRIKYFKEVFNGTSGSLNFHINDRGYVLKKGRLVAGPSQPPKAP